MRVPITTCQQGLKLANSLGVSGKISFSEDPTVSKPLGSEYWPRGFMGRNWFHVKAKKGVEFDGGRRADWYSFLWNFEYLY